MRFLRSLISLIRYPASAAPTACKSCVPVGDDCDTMLSFLWPVRRHLPPVRIRIRFRAHGFEQHLEWRHAELQTERPISIVRIEPIVSRTQAHAGRGQDCFMAGAADLKKDAVLSLHLNLFVVELPGQVHRAENLQHLLATKLRLLLRFRLCSAPTPHRPDGGSRL